MTSTGHITREEVATTTREQEKPLENDMAWLEEKAGLATGEQEWTEEKLQGLLQISNEDRYVADHAFENTLNAINAAVKEAYAKGVRGKSCSQRW